MTPAIRLTDNGDSDGDGFSNRPEADRGTDPTSYVISLRKGWNLIALAGIPDDNSLQNIFGANIRDDAWEWIGERLEVANQNPAGGRILGLCAGGCADHHHGTMMPAWALIASATIAG